MYIGLVANASCTTGSTGNGVQSLYQWVLVPTYNCATATDIAKIGNFVKTLCDPNESIEMIFNKIKDAQSYAICANLGLTYLISLCMLLRISNIQHLL